MRLRWALLLIVLWFAGATAIFWLLASPRCDSIKIEGLSVTCVNAPEGN